MPVKFKQPIPISFSGGMVILLYILLGASLLIPNGIYFLGSLIAIVVIIKLMWNIYNPGVLIFSYVFQWLQVFFFLLWMNELDRSVDGLSKNGGNALMLSLGGLVVMAFLTRLLLGKIQVFDMEDFKKSASNIDQRKLLILYVFSTLFLSTIGFAFGNLSGFAQILVTISSLKWVFLLWLGAIIWVNKTHRIWLVFIIGYEFFIGLYSYFSSFKDVILYVIILSLTFITVIQFKQFIRLVLIGLTLGVVLLVWSAVKGEYRVYLNKGNRQQQVLVSRQEALSKLGEQIGNLKYAEFQKAMIYSTYRLQYVYHFAMAMDKVPDFIPYQNGSVWGENIGFVLTPRALNPNKKQYNASEKVSKFTGRKFAGLKEGSSFSLGYFGDSYIDFGPIGMMFALALIALFTTIIFRVFYKMYHLNLLLRYAIINVSLFVFYTFEADGLFLFGRLLTDFIVFYLLAKFVFPRIQNWVTIRASAF